MNLPVRMALRCVAWLPLAAPTAGAAANDLGREALEAAYQHWLNEIEFVGEYRVENATADSIESAAQGVLRNVNPHSSGRVAKWRSLLRLSYVPAVAPRVTNSGGGVRTVSNLPTDEIAGPYVAI